MSKISANSYYRARYYESNTGRFISEDPLSFDAGIDFYTYVMNNPPSLADPTGLSAWCFFNQNGGIECYAVGGGQMSDPSAYSGYGSFKNNPTYQTWINIGVIPLGYYFIGPPYNGKLGKPQFDLTPTTDPITWSITDPYARDLFRIHADSDKHRGFASEGCIVASPELRRWLAHEGGGVLRVYNPKLRFDSLERLLDHMYPRLRY